MLQNKAKQSGVALLEFSASIIFLMLIILAAFDLNNFWQTYSALNQITKTAALSMTSINGAGIDKIPDTRIKTYRWFRFVQDPTASSGSHNKKRVRILIDWGPVDEGTTPSPCVGISNAEPCQKSFIGYKKDKDGEIGFPPERKINFDKAIQKVVQPEINNLLPGAVVGCKTESCSCSTKNCLKLTFEQFDRVVEGVLVPESLEVVAQYKIKALSLINQEITVKSRAKQRFENTIVDAIPMIFSAPCSAGDPDCDDDYDIEE